MVKRAGDHPNRLGIRAVITGVVLVVVGALIAGLASRQHGQSGTRWMSPPKEHIEGGI